MTLSIDIDDKTFAQDPTRPILRDLHIEISTGEFVAIVGPSGCGKTTLLNIVAGIDPEFHGHIQWPSDGAAPRLGYVFQNPRLLPWLTVRDNVRLVLDGGKAADEHVDELLEIAELSAFADYHPGKISVGMQRRVALARAFVVAPQLLLMDEPFVSLDAPTAALLRSLLLRVWERHRSRVLFVSHDLLEAAQLADRILFLSPSPSRVIAVTEVDVSRHQRAHGAAFESLYRRIRDQFAELYSTTPGDHTAATQSHPQAGAYSNQASTMRTR